MVFGDDEEVIFNLKDGDKLKVYFNVVRLFLDE